MEFRIGTRMGPEWPRILEQYRTVGWFLSARRTFYDPLFTASSALEAVPYQRTDGLHTLLRLKGLMAIIF